MPDDDDLLMPDEEQELEAIRLKVSRRLSIEDSSSDDEAPTIPRAVSYTSSEEKSINSSSDSDSSIHHVKDKGVGVSSKTDGKHFGRSKQREMLQVLWTDSDDSDIDLGGNTLKEEKKVGQMRKDTVKSSSSPIILDSSDESDSEPKSDHKVAQPPENVEEVINLCSP